MDACEDWNRQKENTKRAILFALNFTTANSNFSLNH